VNTEEPAAVQRLRATLEAAGARYRILQHDVTVTSAADGEKQGFGPLTRMAPTLVLKCEHGYLAAILPGHRRLSYKKIKKHLGLRNVSLASPEEVRAETGAEPGAVAMVMPHLRTLVDNGMLEEQELFGGCGAPNYSLVISGAEIARVTGADVFDFTEARTA
jgi:prolyl-tRNA editing enzyme YbaK/EbsC (Cys-tRNA(Pro) deacylase)